MPAGAPRDAVAEVSAAGGQGMAERFRGLGNLFVAILCFEMGLFLLAFPWSHYWSLNYFGWVSPEWREIWMNPYFRGAVSGLGLVNFYVALAEVFRMPRFGGRRRTPE